MQRFFDKKGTPIQEGDLIKSLHFVGARNKKYFMYHYIQRKNDTLWAMHIDFLGRGEEGGCCPLTAAINCTPNKDIEVIHGYDRQHRSYEDREKHPKESQAYFT